MRYGAKGRTWEWGRWAGLLWVKPGNQQGRQPGFPPGQMAAQLHDLRTVEAAKKEFEEYVRQQVSLACWEPGRPVGEEPGIV